MINIFSTAKSGMSAYQTKLDHLSNDLVNASTTAYKSVDVGFKDLLTERLDRKGVPIQNKDAINETGVRIGTEYRNNTQGNLLTTGLKTDLALDGKGYFAAKQPDGTMAYTRDGNFAVDSNGVLVDASGNKVYIEYTNGASEGMPKLSQDNLSVDSKGTISILMNNEMVEVGRIPVFTAVGSRAFLALGSNYFVPDEGVTVTECNPNDYDIRQGYLEASNVDTADTLTSVILTQRAFELSSKAITVADELWGLINSMRS